MVSEGATAGTCLKSRELTVSSIAYDKRSGKRSMKITETRFPKNTRWMTRCPYCKSTLSEESDFDMSSASDLKCLNCNEVLSAWYRTKDGKVISSVKDALINWSLAGSLLPHHYGWHKWSGVEYLGTK